MAVLVSFLKYNVSYLNHWMFLYEKFYIQNINLNMNLWS